MTDTPYTDITRRHDFLLLFDVLDGNPNGDPDAGNLPRVDPETMHGLVTDVALKRKVRDWVDAVTGEEDRYKIYVQHQGAALNALHRTAYTALDITPTGTRQEREDVDQARAWMCENFYDIRVFGAVMTTGVNCGQVRGPMQLTFARSIDPIIPLDISITRVAITREEDTEVVVSEAGDTATGGKQTEMGRKAIVPYGLYRAHGFYNPHYAHQTGLTTEDLELFWRALTNMWDLDRSSARGMMSCRGLHIFSHDSAIGNAPAQQLFDHITISARNSSAPHRRFSDYDVQIRDHDLPAGVTLTRLAG